MAATIKIKNSSTAGAAPTSSDLVQGELAVNVTDKRLYTENASGTVVELGTNPSVPVTFPDGSASAPSLTNDGDTNTGLFFPAADTVGITTGGTERARVDSSGNLGIGVTPSAWQSDYRTLQISTYGTFYGRIATNEAGMLQNIYRDSSGNFKFLQNGYGASYSLLSGGGHAWANWGNNVSGAGAAATSTQAMTLDASGNLLLGTTSVGTMAGNLVQRLANTGIIPRTSNSLANNGTLNIVVSSGGASFTGFLIVESVLISNANVRTQTTYSVFGRGTSLTATSIATVNGPSGGRTFTITAPSTGVISFTNTSGDTVGVNMTFFGSEGF